MIEDLTVVLGGSGDIGSVLVTRLKTSGCRYLAPSSTQVNLTDASSTQTFFSAISEPYVLVFAAFLDRRQGDTEQTLKLNLQMIENVVNFAKPSAVIFLSSMDVYGKNPKLPITESNTTDETSFYSQAKLFAESKLAESFGGKVKLMVLRLPGVYGGHGPRNAALDRIITKGINEGQIDIGDGGSLLRDWIYAEDLARFLIESIVKPIEGLFNFATGESWTINHYVSECLVETQEVRHQIKSIDRATKSQTAADHVFDNKMLRITFPAWQFDDRSLSLKKFTEVTKNHLNKSNNESAK